MRACAAAVCGAFALAAVAQEATRLRQAEVGLERATQVPHEIVWLRDEVLAEIWRQNPGLGQALRSCATGALGKEACAVGAKPPSRNAFGAGWFAGAGSRAVGGGVFLVAPRAQGAALVRVPSGEILLAAGSSVQLVDAAFPDIRIELRAPDDRALPLGNLVTAEPGKVFGLLARPAEAVSASAASFIDGGRVALKASGEVQLAALSRPDERRAPESARAAQIAARAPLAEYPDIDQGSRALAYSSGEGLGTEVALYGAPSVEPSLTTVLAYSGTITLPGAVRAGDAPLAGESTVPAPAPAVAEHVDIDQGSRALAYATGEGLGREVAFHGAAPIATPPEALALRGTIELPLRPAAETIIVASAPLDPGAAPIVKPAPAVAAAPAPQAPAAAPAAKIVNAATARLRAEVEAEIERDRARLVAASQQACASPASVRQGCAVNPPRRFSFAG